MTVPSQRLILPVETEFLDGLRFLCGDGLLAEIKQQLVPVALDLIRISLLGHTHPFETLRGLADLRWEDLLHNPHTPSAINHLLDQVEAHPRLQGVVETLRRPVVMQRLRVEWLYEVSVGRFENSVPYLHKEAELLKEWEQFCASLRDASVNPFDAANQEVQRFLSSRGSSLSEPAQRLYRLSFLAACRKLFVFFSGAKETWAGSYTFESFKLSGSLADHLGHAVEAADLRSNRISLRFGLVDHVYYLKPTLDQLNLFLECIKCLDLTGAIQRKLCPFVALAAEDLNFNLMAEVFYRIYLPGRLRELSQPPQPAVDEAFLRESGMKQDFFARLRFLPLSPETAAFFAEKIGRLPRLRAFLSQPRTESGLLRQRLYRGILDPALSDVAQKTLDSLCRQWNPLLRTPEGATLSLMAYVDGKASRVSRSDPKGALVRDQVLLEELLRILTQNTQSWQKAMEQDSFVVDRARAYFMTVLDKAIEESGSEETRAARYRDSRRVACVVVE
jgi:hypothetical protein